ncbi:hypothetical protein DAEQUDRAFT_730290 [Daedalea quercina L-15889]|uniref:DUF6533 domain-containing protein n=1 Tax=Daedalea quercina L-15889 TaxID=1314783 RepID=A0A165N341_9APHY|nr:hypothetical protein DAEQUDRAFT_730290 [Daedalea quercina L-15889]
MTPTLSQEIRSLRSLSYICGACISLMLYDHALSLGEEIELVRRRTRSRVALLLLIDVVLRECGILFFAIGTSGFIDIGEQVSECYALIIFIMFYGSLSAASAHSIVLYRIFILWDNRKFISYTLISGFFLCFGATVVLSVFEGERLSDQFTYISHACIFSSSRSKYMIAVWCPMVIYNFCVLVFLFVGILGNPRRQDSQIVFLLYRDGFLMFMVLLRIARLIPSTFVNAGEIFPVLIVTWTLESMLSRRLLLRVRQIESGNAGSVYLWQPSQQESSSTSGTLKLVSTVQVWEETEMRVL